MVPDLSTPVKLLLLGIVVTGPLIVLAHEVGHAIVARRHTGRPVLIEVGRGPALTLVSRGYVAVRLRLFPWAGGRCFFSPIGLTVAQERAILAAGPWATAALALVLALAAYLIDDPDSLLYWMTLGGFADSMIAAIYNLWPGKVGSDGHHLMLLHGLPPDSVRRPSI
jgi:membrane-associated protease RseP (regulator of RpoE activity)